MFSTLIKNNNFWGLITSRSFSTPINISNQESIILQKAIEEDDDAILKFFNKFSSSTNFSNSFLQTTTKGQKKINKTTNQLESVEKTKSKSEEYVLNLKLQREENLKRLELLRREEKTQVFNRFYKLLKEYHLNEDVVDNMSKIPLISNEMIESNEISEFYDKEEYEWAIKCLLTHKKEKIPSKNTINLTKWLFPSISSIISIGDEKKYQKLLEWKLNEMDSSSYEGFMAKNAITKRKGVDFHNAIELTFKKQQLPKYEDDIQESVNAIQKIIKEEFKNDFFLLESSVSHSKLSYQGRIDCLGYYKDQFCLIDWKRSDLPKEDKESLHDYPVQLAAYLGAYLNDYNYKEIRKAHNIQGGLIINISDDGQANVHSFNYQQMEFYWYKWINTYRNYIYSMLKLKNEKDFN